MDTSTATGNGNGAVPDWEEQRAVLHGEAQLVADLMMNTLQGLEGVSIVGEFVGLIGFTGGLASMSVASSDPEHVAELAAFFAGRFEDAAKVFRRVEAGEDIKAIIGEWRDEMAASPIPQA